MPEQTWGFEAAKSGLALLLAGGFAASLKAWLDARAIIQKAQAEAKAAQAESSAGLAEAQLKLWVEATAKARAEAEELLAEWRDRYDKLHGLKLDADEALSTERIAHEVEVSRMNETHATALAELKAQIETLQKQVAALALIVAKCPNCPHAEAAK